MSMELVAKITEKHTSNDIHHKYTKKRNKLQNKQYQCVSR